MSQVVSCGFLKGGFQFTIGAVDAHINTRKRVQGGAVLQPRHFRI